MYRKKKPWLTKLLAALLSILLVTYNIPAGLMTAGFADTQGSFSLQLLEDGQPVAADQDVTAKNNQQMANAVATAGKTDNDGVVQLPDLTTKPFGENNLFEFTIGHKSFSIYLTNGTTDQYTYDIKTDEVTPEKYNVHFVQNSGNGKLTLNGTEYIGPVQFAKGDNIQFQITPEAGYEIQTVKIGDGATITVPDSQKDHYTDEINQIDHNTTIEVTYALKNYTVTFNSFQNGTVIDDNGNPVGNAVTAPYHSQPAFTVKPDEGYHIKSITVGGKTEDLPASVTEDTQNYSLQLPALTGNTNVTVTFERNDYVITFNSNGNGKLYDEQNQTIDSAGGKVYVKYGDTPSFTVKPDEGYHVEDITISEKSVYSSSENVTQDVTKRMDKVKNNTQVVVTLAINTYTINVSTDDHGKIDLNQSKVNYGGQVDVTVTPNDNSYQLSKLTVDGQDVAFTENDNGSIVTYSYTISNIQKDTDVAAGFEPVQEKNDSWDKYITVTPIKGKLLKNYTDKDNHDVFVYSNDAELEILPNSASYDLVDYSKLLKELRKNGTVQQSLSIDQLIVKSAANGGKREKITLSKKLYLVFDKAQPTVNTPTLTSDQEPKQGAKGVDGADWYRGNVTIDGTITNSPENTDGVDYSTNIDKVYYSKITDPIDAAKSVKPDANDNNHYTIPLDDQNFKGQYKIWAVDEAGNTTVDHPVIFDTNIDNTKPTLDEGHAVIFDSTNPSVLRIWDKLINFLPFGTYFNKKIEVTVKVKDDASGIQDIALKAIPKDSSEKTLPNIEPVPGTFTHKGLSAEEKFTVDSDSFEGTFAADVTDKVGNTNLIDVTPANSNIKANGDGVVMFDKNAPKVALDVTPNKGTGGAYFGKDSGKEYYNGNVTYKLTVTDPKSGINNVNLKVNGKPYKQYDYSNAQAKKESLTVDDLDTSKFSKNSSYTVSIDAVDNAGNPGAVKPRSVYIDTNPPTLDADNNDPVSILQETDGNAVAFDKIYDGPFFKFLHFLTFGTFFNEKIDVTVRAKDDVSGIQRIDLLAVSEDGREEAVPQVRFTPTSEDAKTATAVFSLDATSFKGTFTVKMTDHVNNENKYPVTTANSNLDDKSGVVMIEKNAPAASINVKAEAGDTNLQSYTDGNGKEFYNHDVVFNFPVRDRESGFNKAELNINGTEINSDTYTNQQQFQYTYLFPTDTKLHNPDGTYKELIQSDGSYHLSVAAIDHAGNVTGDPENLVNSDKPYKLDRTIYIDRTPPEITDFTFSQGGHAGSDKIANSVESTNYGFYFKNSIEVTVAAEDKPADHEAASGVQTITVFAKDYEKNKYYAVLDDGSLSEIFGTNLDMDQVARMVKPIPVSKDNRVTFTIPENFKGKIFAKAIDNVQNSTSIKSPDGAVIENAAKHKEVSNIDLHKDATTFKDNNGLDLYAKDVPVLVTVSDPYSGIARIDWSVDAPYDQAKNQSGTVTVDNDKNMSGDSGWAQAAADQNLVTKMTKTILVSNDSNNIDVHVKLTDRVGNTSEQDLKFSIDKTAPTFNVTYDNNTADGQYTDYYKQDRTATVVVTERNFRPEDFTYQITNKDGGVPKLVGWATAENTQDPNKTTHTATIHYSADGDYTFKAQYKDNAQNAAPSFNEQKFTIDKTVPVVNVSYNNNAASNGNYYKAARTATITIKEHNFDPARVKVAGTASDAAFPALSGWTTNGDDHTATIRYTTDGTYSFDIDFMDKAGNMAADYKPESFVVDQTAPTLSITGVNNQSANKGDVAPVISYSDANFNKNSVSITLTGANRGNVKPEGSLADVENGQVFTFNNFAKDKKVDDLYTLTATLTDFAGNQATQTIQFSVNRFGSVYVFDDSLKKIEGKYVKNEKDVVVTETNVDTLKPETIKVKMTKNGNPTDLAQEKDYTVTHAGGNGKWSQYKYVVKKDLFADDGKYTVALYSEDMAGNINDNNDEAKKAEISFGIDKTAPVILPVDLKSEQQYPVESKPATVSVKDNLVLKGANIYLNGKKVDQKVDGENYTFTIPSSNSKQNVKIVATDAAGNQHVTQISGFLVSTNPIVRLYNNTPLFMGSIGGVGVLGAAAVYLAVRNMRKEDEEE